MTGLEKRFPRYSRLLKLYPVAYQKAYSEQTLQTLADMLDNTESRSERTQIWLRAVLELPIMVTKQQLIATGDVMSQTMPNYIKLSSLIGALFIAPFFVFMFLHLFFGDNQLNNWFSTGHTSFLWFIALPLAAFALNLLAFGKWYHDERQTKRAGFFNTIFDFRQTWPVVLVAILGVSIAVFIRAHDSTHCVLGNPIHEVSNWHETVQCIEQKPGTRNYR